MPATAPAGTPVAAPDALPAAPAAAPRATRVEASGPGPTSAPARRTGREHAVANRVAAPVRAGLPSLRAVTIGRAVRPASAAGSLEPGNLVSGFVGGLAAAVGRPTAPLLVVLVALLACFRPVLVRAARRRLQAPPPLLLPLSLERPG